MDKTTQKHINIFQGGRPITESEILHARARLAHARATPELQELWALLVESPGEWQLTPEQTRKGLAWLQANRGRKLLRVSLEPEHWRIIDDFDRFALAGLLPTLPGSRYTSPIYRVYSRDGKWFDYTYIRGEIQVVG